MIRLYHLYVDRWGEPKDLWVYDPRDCDDPPPNIGHCQVAVWPADRHCDVTGFITLGMSDHRMRGAKYFTELHLGCRVRLKKQDRERMARYLANIAEYPFTNDLKLNWWEVITKPGNVPFFPGCRHLLLHPRLTTEGVDVFEDEEGSVRLLYVVPITPLEHHLFVAHGRDALVGYFAENEIDVLSDRSDVKE